MDRAQWPRAALVALLWGACSGDPTTAMTGPPGASGTPPGAGSASAGQGSDAGGATPPPSSGTQPGARQAPIANDADGGAGTGPARLPDAGAPALHADAGGNADAAMQARVGLDCDVDPLASQQVFGRGFYQEFRGLFGCTPAADRALFRELLPAKFDMPSDPQVCFYTIDFINSGVGPYHEVALMLPIEYAGQAGQYVLTMVLDNQAATTGGRALGFPKYLGEVSLEQAGNDWTATGGSHGTIDLAVRYTGQCNAQDVFLWPDFINLTPIPAGETSSEAFLPPRDGRALRVPAEYLTDPSYYSLKGSVRIQIGDHLPWNGLIDESKPFTGYLTTFKGGLDLGNQPLD